MMDERGGWEGRNRVVEEEALEGMREKEGEQEQSTLVLRGLFEAP
jgi:hypothetical protein